MEILSVNFIHLLRPNQEQLWKMQLYSIVLESNRQPCDSGATL
jgi:hypothetical protein